MKCTNCDNDPGIGLPAGVGLKDALQGKFKCGQCDTVLRRTVSKRAKITIGVFFVLYLILELSYNYLPEPFKNFLEEPLFIFVFGGLLFLMGGAGLVFFIKDLSCKKAERSIA